MGMSLLMAEGRKPPSAPPPTFSTWLTYWDTLRGLQALTAVSANLEEVELFAYHFTMDNKLVPASANFKELQEAFGQLPSPNPPRLAITLVNDLETPQGILLKDPASVHRAIATPAARDAHIRQILAIAENAESIDIDYERVAPEDGAAFTAFIQALASALHQKGKRLSVVVEPRVADPSTWGPLGNGPNALSWSAIAQAADRLTVMAYLYHYGASDPGSIAPVAWVGDVTSYGLRSVPPDKLCIALHLGGFDWTKGAPGKSLDYDKAGALAAAYGKPIELDLESQSGHFTYSDGSSDHDVWIETADGLKAKIDKVRSLGVTHIALWRLGTGDPTFWDNLSHPK